MNRFWLVLLAGCGAATTTPIENSQSPTELTLVDGTTDTFHYRDAAGAEVMRAVTTEALPNGDERLLVVEWPADAHAEVLQRSIFRERYAAADLTALHAAQASFSREMRPAAASAEALRPFPTITADSRVWTATKSWTLEEENTYAAWVAANASVDMFSGAGLQVDCADAAELIRWSYAHDHGLPAGNSLTGSGRLFGNWTMQSAWNALPTDPDWHKDQRFLTAFRYLQNNMYTHTLVNDLYPTQLSRDYITPGSIHLMYEGATGHTETFFAIAPPGSCSLPCMQTIWGNEPASDELFTSELIGMQGESPGTGGFLRHRWPVQTNGVWKLTAAAAMPGYSTEQFQYAKDDDASFADVIYGKMGIVLTPLTHANLYAQTLEQLLSDRVAITQQGYVMCGFTHCATTDPLYDQYSTPIRDARIVNLASLFAGVFAQLSASDADSVTWDLDYTFVDGLDTSMKDYVLDHNGILQAMASDPNADFFARWGVTALGDADATFAAYTRLAESTFTQIRATLVAAGVTACFPKGGAYATCSHTAAAIKALSTSRFDAGYRALASHVSALQAAASSSEQQAMHSEADAHIAERYGLCPGKLNSWCTMASYLFDTPALLQKMTSDAWDAPATRWGG